MIVWYWQTALWVPKINSTGICAVFDEFSSTNRLNSIRLVDRMADKSLCFVFRRATTLNPCWTNPIFRSPFSRNEEGKTLAIQYSLPQTEMGTKSTQHLKIRGFFGVCRVKCSRFCQQFRCEQSFFETISQRCCCCCMLKLHRPKCTPHRSSIFNLLNYIKATNGPKINIDTMYDIIDDK